MKYIYNKFKEGSAINFDIYCSECGEIVNQAIKFDEDIICLGCLEEAMRNLMEGEV